MKKIVATIALAATMSTGLAVGAAAASAAPADGQCVKAGLATLKSLGAIPAAAKGQVDYSDFADSANGPIRRDLPAGSNLPLNEVIRLHQTAPELFAWCD